MITLIEPKNCNQMWAPASIKFHHSMNGIIVRIAFLQPWMPMSCRRRLKFEHASWAGKHGRIDPRWRDAVLTPSAAGLETELQCCGRVAQKHACNLIISAPFPTIQSGSWVSVAAGNFCVLQGSAPACRLASISHFKRSRTSGMFPCLLHFNYVWPNRNGDVQPSWLWSTNLERSTTKLREAQRRLRYVQPSKT
jgi:hypothetical protein